MVFHKNYLLHNKIRTQAQQNSLIIFQSWHIKKQKALAQLTTFPILRFEVASEVM